MSNLKPAIPDMMGVQDPAARGVLSPMKDNLEYLLGRRGGKLQKLGPTPQTGDIVNTINAIIDRLQA